MPFDEKTDPEIVRLLSMSKHNFACEGSIRNEPIYKPELVEGTHSLRTHAHDQFRIARAFDTIE